MAEVQPPDDFVVLAQLTNVDHCGGPDYHLDPVYVPGSSSSTSDEMLFVSTPSPPVPSC